MNWREKIEQQMRQGTASQSFWFGVVVTLPAMIWELAVTVLNFLYDKRILRSRKLSGIVWSVGNLEVGGTGKSPLVEELAKGLVQRGFRPVVLTRGYGTKIGARDVVMLVNGELAKRTPSYKIENGLPDEARMISAKCTEVPVVCSPNRWFAAKWYMASLDSDLRGSLVPTHWILDDGFQHRKLQRDKDIVVLDSSRPYGNGWCIPRGTLRESMAGLARATQIVTSGNGALNIGHTGKAIYSLEAGPSRLLVPTGEGLVPWEGALSGALTIMTAIARPQRVVDTLKAGFAVSESKLVTQIDHKRFDRAHVEAEAAQCAHIVITTKDYWRHPEVWRFDQNKVLVLSVDWHINDTIWSALLV